MRSLLENGAKTLYNCLCPALEVLRLLCISYVRKRKTCGIKKIHFCCKPLMKSLVSSTREEVLGPGAPPPTPSSFLTRKTYKAITRHK